MIRYRITLLSQPPPALLKRLQKRLPGLELKGGPPWVILDDTPDGELLWDVQYILGRAQADYTKDEPAVEALLDGLVGGAAPAELLAEVGEVLLDRALRALRKRCQGKAAPRRALAAARRALQARLWEIQAQRYPTQVQLLLVPPYALPVRYGPGRPPTRRWAVFVHVLRGTTDPKAIAQALNMPPHRVRDHFTALRAAGLLSEAA